MRGIKRCTAAVISMILACAFLATATPTSASVRNAQPFRWQCEKFTNEEVWQTSGKWARLRQRTCIEWTDTQIRSRFDIQVDWPSDCSLTVGWPVSGSLSCPSRGYFKDRGLTFSATKLRVWWYYPETPSGVQMGFNESACQGGTWYTHKSYPNFDDEWRKKDGANRFTKSCRGVWVPKHQGKYVVSGQFIGNIKNDGEDWRQMSAVQGVEFKVTP